MFVYVAMQSIEQQAMKFAETGLRSIVAYIKIDTFSVCNCLQSIKRV
jgi:hypothetical protein